MNITQEELRLQEVRQHQIPWKKWGPYLRERQWGSVREDYSQNGDACNHISHDQARSRAFRWGEDGIAGSPMTTKGFVLRWPCGMGKIPF